MERAQKEITKEIKKDKSYIKNARACEKNNKSKQSGELILSVMWKESSFDQSKKAKDSTATGLMMVTKGAAKDAGYDYNKVKTDPETNVQAGSAYLQIRIDQKGGNVKDGLNGYGTGAEHKYADDILESEKELKENPSEPFKALENIRK